MTSTTWFDNSPFHLVPCSPYVGTNISSKSPAPRAVPDIGETNQIFVPDSPRSIAGQDVPQTPTLAQGHSYMLHRACLTPCKTQRAATPEQQVPQTPMKKDVSANKPKLTDKLKSNDKTTPSIKDGSREINLFHGDDIFG